MLDAEFDLASSDGIFERELGLGVGVGVGEGESEDQSENQGDTDPFPHHHILTHTHTPKKYHHSTQDQILHPAQPTRQPAQFHERISARNTRIRC